VSNATRTRNGSRPKRRASVDGGIISLFSGALGLDLGLERSGLRVRVAVESDGWAASTLRANREDFTILDQPIEHFTSTQILEAAGMQPGEPTVVSAGPSCQAFSTAGRRRSLDDERGTLFREFLRVVKETQPRFFVMENVRGVLSAAIRHRPLAERGPGHPTLSADEQHGSAFQLILRELAALDYYIVFGLIDAADYGAPQHRHRILWLGSRDGEDIRLPDPTHAEQARRGAKAWVTLGEGLTGLDDPEPLTLPLSPVQQRLLKRVPAGGNWRDLPPRLQREALGRAYESWGGRSGFYRRLRWDAPAPALTTRPNSKATMFVHPDELRTLSVGEYACLQGFDPGWRFAGGPAQQFLQIGNAVPLPIGHAVGRGVAARLAGPDTRDASRKGVVACGDSLLIERLNRRPRTVLNPDRMRDEKGLAAAREWMRGLGGAHREPVEVAILPEAA
jgi:DNA (cytosine-5)-methyltransferase 1